MRELFTHFSFENSRVRPISQYANEIKNKHARTEKENFGFASENTTKESKSLLNGGHGGLWYRDVIELRKKAEEYRVRISIFVDVVHN